MKGEKNHGKYGIPNALGRSSTIAFPPPALLLFFFLLRHDIRTTSNIKHQKHIQPKLDHGYIALRCVVSQARRTESNSTTYLSLPILSRNPISVSVFLSISLRMYIRIR